MKRQLNRLKGKRLVTGDPNLMTKDEICINTTPNGVEVKEIGTDGKIKDLAGSSGSSSDNKDEGQWYKIEFKVPNPDTGEYMTVYAPLIADSDYSSVIFDRVVFYMAENGGIGGDGNFCFCGDIPFDLSYKYINYFHTFVYKYIVGVHLNPYVYDIVDYGTGVPLRYIKTINEFEQHIDYMIEYCGKYSNKKYDNKYLQYLHLCALASVIILSDSNIKNYVSQTFYDRYEYPTIEKIFDKCEEYQYLLLDLPILDEALSIEPTTKEELLQIAKEQVENYINN